jgi:tetratricopeptide (TPR) repeat protein
MWLRILHGLGLTNLADEQVDRYEMRSLTDTQPTLAEQVESARRLRFNYSSETAFALERLQALESGEYQSSIGHLRKAIQESPKSIELRRGLSILLTSKAVDLLNRLYQKKLHVNILREAMEMLQEAVTLDPENKSAIENRATIESLVSDYGGLQALEWYWKAVEAFNYGQHEESAQLLRRAISISSQPSKLKETLSIILSNLAVETVNTHLGKISNSTLVHQKLLEAKAMLEEAIKLSNENEHAKSNLEILKEINFKLS